MKQKPEEILLFTEKERKEIIEHIKNFVNKYVEKVNKGEPTNYFEDEFIHLLYLRFCSDKENKNETKED